MNQNASRLAAAFLIGFAGWLAAGALRVEGLWVFVAAVAVGVIAGVVVRRPIALPAVWLGMLATYPVALALGVFAFLGENWALYLVLFALAAGIGFGASLVILRRVAIPRAGFV